MGQHRRVTWHNLVVQLHMPWCHRFEIKRDNAAARRLVAMAMIVNDTFRHADVKGLDDAQHDQGTP